MKKLIYTAESRGFFNHGWMRTYHSFSFAKYNNPLNINFGALRVLNDDFVKGGKGMGKHHHDNMEIISIPLHGTLAYEDSTGHKGIIKPDDVQVISAGTGLVHAEYNGSQTEEVNFLQIWIYPFSEGLDPRYNQKSFSAKDRQNKIQTFISPDTIDNNLLINQNAFLSWTSLDKDFSVTYHLYDIANGLYIFIIEGSAFIDDQPLHKRDGIAISEIAKIKIHSTTHSEIMIIEVPMI